MNNLDSHKSHKTSSNTIELVTHINGVALDESYLNMIHKGIDGYYFHNSLQLYSHSDEAVETYNNIRDVNEQFFRYYGDLFDGLATFGQDLFGNQFCFGRSGILFFNSETAEAEHLVDHFEEWLLHLFKDLDYLTGQQLAAKLKENKKKELIGGRLYPKKPFVDGGTFDFENTFNLKYPDYISYYSNIAKQVKNLPDGSTIKFKIIE